MLLAYFKDNEEGGGGAGECRGEQNLFVYKLYNS